MRACKLSQHVSRTQGSLPREEREDGRASYDVSTRKVVEGKQRGIKKKNKKRTTMSCSRNTFLYNCTIRREKEKDLIYDPERDKLLSKVKGIMEWCAICLKFWSHT